MDQFSASAPDPVHTDDHEDGDDDDTEVERSRQHRKRGKRSRRLIQIRTHKKGGLYYENARGEKVDTTKKEWTKVKDGYELEGRSHVYYTKSFPR